MNAFAPFLAPLPLIAVLRGITPEETPGVAGALFEAGFRVLEVPLNSPRVRVDRAARAAAWRPLPRRRRHRHRRRRRRARPRRRRAAGRDAARRHHRGARGEGRGAGMRAGGRDADRGIRGDRGGRRRPQDVSGGGAAAGRAEGVACRAAQERAGVRRRGHPPGDDGGVLGRRGRGLRHWSNLSGRGRTGRGACGGRRVAAAAVRCRRGHERIRPRSTSSPSARR